MNKEPNLDYPTVCLFVGQLFLETRFKLEQLKQELEQAKSERDEAISKLVQKKE